MLRYFSTLLTAFILVVLIGSASGLLVLYYYGAGLPDYNQLAKYEPPILTRFYANDGRMYAEYAAEKRLFVPLDAIPSHVIQAFISAEDKNFYDHIGVDFMSIVSAAITNISRIQSSKRPIGASTITQQVARNFLLTDISTKVSLERKIKEAILAFRIEQAFTKNHILELYLNEIYLGSGSYGVAAAALNYFNKGLNELTVGEVAFLAALPKAPSRYHPSKAPQLARTRRDYVLRRMLEDGCISPEIAQKEMEQPVNIRSRAPADIVKAEYFAEEVRRELVGKYGERVLYQEGMTVRTTLDPTLQKIAAQAFRGGLIDYDRRHGWRGPLKTVVLTPAERLYQKNEGVWIKTLQDIHFPVGKGDWKAAIVLDLKANQAIIGLEDATIGNIALTELQWARKHISAGALGPVIRQPKDVLAVGDIILVENLSSARQDKVASKNYALRQIPQVSGGLLVMDPHTGRVLAMQGGFSFDISQYNRTTQAMRQTGSAFKTFVYLTALERGLTPATKIDDAPFTIQLGYGLGTWSPRNYEENFWGLLTLRRAFELSRNTVTVRMTHEYVGMKNVVETAKRFGIMDHMPLQLAMVLGAGETTLLKMVRATSMIANGGKEITPTFIDRIQNRHGKTVFTDPALSYTGPLDSVETVPSLKDKRKQIIDSATAYQMVSLMEGVATRGTGKCLQELGRPVAGKSGTTNDFKDAWFIGFTPDLVVGVYVGFDQPRYMGMHESGGRLASPIVKNFLKMALANTPATPFRIPPGIKLVRLDPLTGLPAASGDKNSIWEAFKTGTEIKKSLSDDGQIIQDKTQSAKTVDQDIIPQKTLDLEGNLGGLY